jgi:hypothetical protein
MSKQCRVHTEKQINKKTGIILEKFLPFETWQVPTIGKHLLYISVSIMLVVQKTTAVTLSFCFSRNRRTVPE